MEGVEIVITPRTLERAFFILVIIGLASVLVWKWDALGIGGTSNTMTGEAVLEAAPEEEAAPAAAANVSDNPCENGIKDGGEMDVDCGGDCGACDEFQACNVDDDCADGLYCYQHIKCLKPGCDDGIRNQDETNVDCGGTCGGYWWKADGKCHNEEEPSGLLEGSLKVKITESALSGFAKLDEVTLKVENGLTELLSLQAEFYARSSSGVEIFSNKEGEFPFATISFSVRSGEAVTKTVDMTENSFNTLQGYDKDDNFIVVAVLKDKVKKNVIEEFTWEND